MGELSLLNPVGQVLDLAVVMGDPVILRFVEAAVGDEGTDGLQFTGIEPDAVITANVDHDPRDFLKVFFHHRSAAADTWEIAGFGLQGGALVTFGYNQYRIKYE